MELDFDNPSERINAGRKMKKYRGSGRKDKMTKSSRDMIQELQTELLQDFFEVKMMDAFQDEWKSKVLDKVVEEKEKSDKSSVYKDIKRIYDDKGIENITVKDFDVTALMAMFRKETFKQECCPDNAISSKINHIRVDRNNLSHISNYNDVHRILELEETAVNNMIEFLLCLQDNSWNQPVIFRKYLGTGYGDGKLNEIKDAIAKEASDENQTFSYIRHYMQDLQIIREDHADAYVALSYNLDGRDDEKKLLDDLITANLDDSQMGMRIVAEGGYGKSWTLFEIAGRYAEKYLDDNGENDSPIPLVIEMGKLYKDCASITKKIAQMIFKGDESRVPDFYKNNRIILLVDAMDEAKTDIQSDVSRELASLRDTYPNITFVCASRKSCIDKYPIEIPCYAIKQLDDRQIIEYMEKTIPEELQERVKKDWIGEDRKEFLNRNRTPFYISCYVELVCETGDNDFVDTTQLMEKFLNSMIEREITKTGFNSDKATFINFLKEFCRLLDFGNEDGQKVVALPENDVIRELSGKIIVEEGQASIKAVGRKLVEIQILERDDDEMLLSFAHQNYKEYINRKYPERKFRKSWT
jgi:hypothetical protein